MDRSHPLIAHAPQRARSFIALATCVLFLFGTSSLAAFAEDGDAPVEIDNVPTATAVPPTATIPPPTATSIPPTATIAPPTATTAPPTATTVPTTATSPSPAEAEVPQTTPTAPMTATTGIAEAEVTTSDPTTATPTISPVQVATPLPVATLAPDIPFDPAVQCHVPDTDAIPQIGRPGWREHVCTVSWETGDVTGVAARVSSDVEGWEAMAIAPPTDQFFLDPDDAGEFVPLRPDVPIAGSHMFSGVFTFLARQTCLAPDDANIRIELTATIETESDTDTRKVSATAQVPVEAIPAELPVVSVSPVTFSVPTWLGNDRVSLGEVLISIEDRDVGCPWLLTVSFADLANAYYAIPPSAFRAIQVDGLGAEIDSDSGGDVVIAVPGGVSSSNSGEIRLNVVVLLPEILPPGAMSTTISVKASFP